MRTQVTPEAVVERYEKTAALNRQRLEELDRVLCRFTAAGFEVLPLKGADLLGRAYGGMLGIRPMVDVDLLVRASDLPRMEGLLEASGFTPRGSSGNPTYVSDSHALCLDLFSEIWYLDDPECIWGRVVRRMVAGRLRPAMHPEDALVYLVAYQSVHRAQLSPRTAQDVAALLEAEAPLLDWHRVLDRVTAWHLRIPFLHGLAYARDYAHAAVPAWVFQALEPRGSQRWLLALYRRLVTERGIRQLGYALLPLSRPGLVGKANALWSILFPPDDFLALRYGCTDRWARLWMRLTRPVRLLVQAAAVMFRLVLRVSGLGGRR